MSSFQIKEEDRGYVVYVNGVYDTVHADEAHAKVRVQMLGLHDFGYFNPPEFDPPKQW